MMLSGDGVMTPAFEAGGGFNPAVTSIVSAPFTPKQMETAYGETGLKFGTIPASGAGQTIAIIDAYNDPTIVTDLAAFDAYYHLSAPPSFKVYDEFGNQINPANVQTVSTGYGTYTGALDNSFAGYTAPAWYGVNPVNVVPNGTAGGWDIEESLDIEWAHAMAPKANLELIETNSNYNFTFSNRSDLVWGGGYTAGNSPGVSAVSMSWGGGEYSSENYPYTGGNGDGEFTQNQAPYKTYLASTGDYFVSGPQQVEYPSVSNKVVGVGGTSLVALAPSGTYLSESGWGNNYGASTGGYSVGYETNTFQYGGGGPYDKSVPDLSADADPYTGVDIVDKYYWGSTTPFGNIGGTSLASPLMAGIVAEVNQGRVLAGKPTLQNLEQDLYNGTLSWSTDFHDPFNGSNGYFKAGAGYDYVTGIGSPNGATFINALVSAASTAVAGGATTSRGEWNISTASGSGAGGVHPVVVGLPGAPDAGPTVSTQVTSNVQVNLAVPTAPVTSAGATTPQVAVAPAAADASFAALSDDSTAEDTVLGASLGGALSDGRDGNGLFGGSTSESMLPFVAAQDAPRDAQATVAAPVAELAPVDAVFAAEAAVAIETELSSGLVDGNHAASAAAMDTASLVPLAVVLAGYWASGNTKDADAAKKRARRGLLRLQQR